MKRMPVKRPIATILAVPWLLHAGWASAAENGLEGDIGVGVTRMQAQVRGVRSKTNATPYLNFEHGPVFVRIDTLGVKSLQLGQHGHLEFVVQYRGDGYKSTELQPRQDSVPLGLGTLQITPAGAFEIHVLRDVGKSGGTLVQARYLAEFALGPITVYPELGAEYQSRAYTDYYYGTTDADAATLGQAYRAGSALNPFIGAMVETRIAGQWYANAYVRRTVVDDSIARSPLVLRRNQNTLLLALAYRF
jgi:hypothetical protein